jgi:hypothetical protein
LELSGGLAVRNWVAGKAFRSTGVKTVLAAARDWGRFAAQV